MKNEEIEFDPIVQNNARQYLLSHGNTPHYHRRKTFSLLSSGWIQVVPVRYGRRANRTIRLRAEALDQKINW